MRAVLINSRTNKSRSVTPPLGIMYLGGYLRDGGHVVKLIDKLFYSDDEIVYEIESFRPDLVGMSVMTLNFAVSRELMSLIQSGMHKYKKKVYYCAGGIHPTIMPFKVIEKMNLDPA